MSSNNNNNNPDVNDALNEFYKLKSTYETEYYIKYVKPIISSKVMSKREKKVAYSKMNISEYLQQSAEILKLRVHLTLTLSMRIDLHLFVKWR